MPAYDDYLRILQTSQQTPTNPNIQDPYTALNYALSNAVSGFLTGRERKNKRVEGEFLNELNARLSAPQPAQGLPSSQVQGMASGAGLPVGAPAVAQPDPMQIFSELSQDPRYKGNSRIAEIGNQLIVQNLEAQSKSKYEMAVNAHQQGLISARDLQQAEFDRKTELERIAAQAGADVGEAKAISEYETGQLDIRGNRDLERKKAEIGYEAGTDVWKRSQEEGILTGELGKRKTFETDENIRQAAAEKKLEVDNFLALNPDEWGTPQEATDTNGKTIFFRTSKRGDTKILQDVAPELVRSASDEGDKQRVISDTMNKLKSGQQIPPGQMAQFEAAVSGLTAPKPEQFGNAVVNTNLLTREQLTGTGTPRVSSQEAVSGPNLNSPVATPALMKALIRQESGGNPRARSPAGARGITQFMPETAIEVAKRMGIGNFTLDMLDNPEISYKMGEFHLTELLKKYGGNTALALSAYNAGPGATDKWIKKFGDPNKGKISTQEWVNRVPYAETRGYIKNIIGNIGRDTEPQQAQSVSSFQRPLSKPLSPQQQVAGMPVMMTVPPSATEAAARDKAEREKQAAIEQKKTATEQANIQNMVINTTVDEALALVGPWTSGMSGKILGNVSGTEAATLKSKIKTLKALVGFDQLAQMRASSPTGAALGAIEKSEMDLLQSVQGDLDNAQDPEELKKTLVRVKAITNGIVNGDWSGLSEADKASLGKAEMAKLPVVVTDADYDALDSGTEFVGDDGVRYRKP